MKYLVKDTNGFSLVEILVVVAVFGVIIGAVYSIFITNQRVAYTSDETVEVQQNLRIAMDTIVKDLRMAGMLVNTSVTTPILIGTDNQDPKDTTQTLGQNPQLLGSDTVTINMSSASGVYARITADAALGSNSFSIAKTVNTHQASDAASFSIGDVVRIIRPLDSTPLAAAATPYKVESIVIDPNPYPATDTISISPNVVEDVRNGDVIVKVNNVAGGNDPNPNTVMYSVVDNGPAATARADPNCPVNQRCLARLANGDALNNRQIVAQNIADFQLRYVLEDETIVNLPTAIEYSKIKSVIVTIWGETQTTRMLSGNVPKIRQLSSVVKLRNKKAAL